MRTHASAVRKPRSARHDAHERQADQVARRFMRRETQLARFITPAPAAGFTLPQSPGVPLAGGLRAELEQAFGADLGAVRLHHDVYAAAAARDAGAYAFASGADVYFGGGMYQPGSPSGRILLAHEVTHVLQQTGRVSAHGFAPGAAVSGTGPVQCNGPITSGSTPREVESQKEGFDLLARLHSEGDNKELDDTIAEARALLGGRLSANYGKPAWAAKFNEAVATGKFDKRSPSARSFVVDCLKPLGFFKEAARLLEADPEFKLRTLSAHEKFGDYLLHSEEFGRPRLAPLLAQRVFSKLWPAAILRGWRQYYLRPTYVPAFDAALARQLSENIAELNEKVARTPPELKGEHYWVAWKMISDLEDERIRENNALRKRLVEVAHGKRSIHEVLVELIPALRREEQKKLENPATLEYQRALADGKITLLDDALPIWTRALADYTSWRTAFEGLSSEQLLAPDSAASFPDSGIVRDLATPLRKPLVDASRALLRTTLGADGKPQLPPPDEYKQRVDAFVTALAVNPFALKKGGEKLAWADHVDTLLLQEATAGRPDSVRVAALAVFPLVVDGLLGLAFSYDVEADQKSPSFTDRRLAHRARMARMLAFVGRWLKWDDLVDVVQPVLSDEEDPAHAQATPVATLWLISDWEPDEIRPIARLVEDFPRSRSAPIIEDTPLTGEHLVQWFRYSYHKDLRERMENILRYEDFLRADSPLDFDSIAAARQSREQVKQAMAPSAEAELAIPGEQLARAPLKIPQRFVVQDYELLIPPGATVNWRDLLGEHRKTKLQLERRAAYLIFPDQRISGAFAWMLPPLDGLLAVMRKIPRLVQLAKDYGIPEDRWMEGLSPADNRSKGVASDATVGQIKLTAEDWEQFNAALLRWLNVLGEHEEKQLPGMRRRLTILRRRWVILNLDPLIRHFAEYPYVSHGPLGESDKAFQVRLETPQTVVNAVTAFESFARSLVIDGEDQKSRDAAAESAETQTALLIIGLAPALLEIGQSVIDGYFKRHLYAFYSLAIDHISDETKLARLKNGLGPEDEVAATVVNSDRRLETKQRMEAVLRSIEKELEESQSQRGYSSHDGKTILPHANIATDEIVASKKPDPQYEWRLGQTLGAEGRLDEDSGVLYRLVEVYCKFEFHPHAGSRPVAGLRKGQGGPYSAAWIVLDGKRYSYDEPGIPDTDLFKILIGEHETIVRANDLAMLEELDEIFMWRSFSIGMLALAEAIETFEQYLMLVVSIFVPEVAMAEFVATMGMMLATGQFNDLIHQLKDDPLELIGKAKDAIQTRLFNPDEIWKYMLLGGQHSPWEWLAQLLPARPKKVQASPRTKFGRIAAALRAIGARFQYALKRVREYVQPPLRRVQGRIALHPTLTWLLRKAAGLIRTLLELIPMDKVQEAMAGEGFIDLIKADTTSIDQGFRERVVELFEGIERFELPGELINLDIATEIIISFILDRFGPRGKIVRALLQTMPIPDLWSKERPGNYKTAMQLLSGEIAKVWRGTPLDPNEYWRDAIKDRIGPKFKEVRDELVKWMYDLVDGVLEAMGLPKLERPQESALTQTEVVPEPLLPESEGAVGRSAPTQGKFAISAAGGSPLPGPLRATLESALAADFSHVRLHPGASAATATLGADALTSGSHIFMRPGVSPTSASGRGLLAHEATHVVQQTGRRGAESLGARSPTLGRPGRGLRFDPERESVAQLVARQVAGGKEVSLAVRQRVGRASGVQPGLSEVAENVLETLTQANNPEDFTRRLEGGRNPEGWKEASELAQSLLGKLNTLTGLEFAPFLKDTKAGNVPELVHKYLTEETKHIPDIELKRVAALAQKPRRKKAKDEPDTELNPKAFLQLLANYIYAKRHVGLRVEHDSAVKKVEKVAITYLNIAEVGGTAELWKLVMKTSFGSSAKVKDLGKAQRDIRERLRALQGQPSVWDSSHYRFAGWLIREYEDLVEARERGKVTDVPEWREYTKTDSTKGDGLAVSTHGDLTSRGIGAFDRESHHTTQYLLVEFFGNAKDASRQAFPEPYGDFALPGAYFNKKGPVFSAANDGTVDSIVGSEKLDIKPLNPNSNRGEGMPTILLSARCHQRGELHVLRQRWNDDGSHSKEMHGNATQGYAIENQFNAAITDPELRPRNTDKKHREKLREKLKAKPLEAGQQYYQAALATYRWMRGYMLPRLEHGLLTEEKAYYRGIAAQSRAMSESEPDKLQDLWDLPDIALRGVHEKAVTNNDEVMGHYNWKA